VREIERQKGKSAASRAISRLARHGLAASFLSILWSCGADPNVSLPDEVTEGQFDGAIDTVYAAFSTDVAGAGIWDFRRDWSSTAESAWSARSGSKSRTYVAGGFARRPELTEDAFLLTLCHETGHFLAGAPLNAQGLAVEGQADWYATQVCLPRLWAGADVPDAPASEMDPALPDAEIAACAGGDETASSRCRRTLRAAWSAMHMAAARRELPAPLFSTPDPSIAPATVTAGYPGLQCRLDTMRAGALGLARPRCWFAPID
jgi:hypothetical protein